jgi:sugar lactone lactonase YvrE
VAWRATSAEGLLPHPWVTALAAAQGSVYIGTYGGGVVRRTPDARYEPFVETDGLKVSAGGLVEARGALWLGTEGHGLLRLTADGSRFEPVSAWLPSPRVTAILPIADGLLVGTDEGLARVAVEPR